MGRGKEDGTGEGGSTIGPIGTSGAIAAIFGQVGQVTAPTFAHVPVRGRARSCLWVCTPVCVGVSA